MNAKRNTLMAVAVGAALCAGGAQAESKNYTDLTGQNLSEDVLIQALSVPVRGIGQGCAGYQEEMTRLTRGIGTLPQTAEEVPALKTLKSAGVTATFDINSAELTSDAKEQLEVVAEALNSQSLANQCFQIAGHTCDLGDASYNMELSRKRAESVKQFLVSRGVDGERLVTTGYGETLPLVPNNSEPTRHKNRRVDLGALAPESRI